MLVLGCWAGPQLYRGALLPGHSMLQRSIQTFWLHLLEPKADVEHRLEVGHFLIGCPSFDGR